MLYFFIYLATSRASQLSSKVESKNKTNISYFTLLFGFFMGVLSGIFYISDFWVFSMIAFIGIYIVENVRKPILTGFIADNVPNEILTSVISAQSLLKTIITAGLALALGVIADYLGIGLSFLIVSLFLISVSILMTLFYGKRMNA